MPVRSKVLVDGGIREGIDVLNMLALGAHAVMIGRPICIAAFGAGQEGVSFYLQEKLKELKKAMILTGCGSKLLKMGTKCTSTYRLVLVNLLLRKPKWR